MMEQVTYENWIRPEFAPPASWFGPVWTFLYMLIAVSFGAVFYNVYKKKIPRLIALPFVLNLFFNFIFTYIQFGLNNLVLASIDIVLVLATLIWATTWIYPYSKQIAYAQIPYLLWVAFATILQLSILQLNIY